MFHFIKVIYNNLWTLHYQWLLNCNMSLKINPTNYFTLLGITHPYSYSLNNFSLPHVVHDCYTLDLYVELNCSSWLTYIIEDFRMSLKRKVSKWSGKNRREISGVSEAVGQLVGFRVMDPNIRWNLGPGDAQWAANCHDKFIGNSYAAARRRNFAVVIFSTRPVKIFITFGNTRGNDK